MPNRLNTLAKAAAEFYEVPFEKLRSPCREAVCTKPRHTCQWIADDAGYKKSDIARYWKLDRTAVYYGVKIVSERIRSSTYEAAELRRFLTHIKKYLP
jgi:chromosomal replication initiation ATPase DnaA